MRRLNRIFNSGNGEVQKAPILAQDNDQNFGSELDVDGSPELDGSYGGSTFSEYDESDTFEGADALREDQLEQQNSVPWRKNSRAQNRAKTLNIRRWRNRISLGLAGCTAIVLVVGGFWAHTTGRWDVAKFQLKNTAEASIGSFGLTLQEFVLEGERQYTTKTQIRESLNTSRGEPILAVEPDILRQRLLTLPWVKEVMVERVLPNRIVVTLEEHRPLAVWQFQGKQSLLDQTGKIIEVNDLEKFSELPLLVGNQADQFAPEFISMISTVARLAKRIKVAQFVNGRRWTLKLDNGILIHLPEENALEALNRVAILDKTDSLLSRDVLEIDLRLADRMVVRTNSGADTEIQSGTGVTDLGAPT